MLAWGPYAHPTSSFNKPVPLPGAEPDWGPCATVSFSRTWLPYVLGAMTQLLLQTTWDTDDESEFLLVQEQASTLIAMFAQQGWDDMSGCGCSGIPSGAISRWDEDGDLQVSYDGGATWTDYPQGDPRQTATLFPPINPSGVVDVQCAAAENIVANFTGQIDQYADQLEAVGGFAEFLATVGASIAVYLGFAAPITAFVTLLASELFTLGAEAVRSAFDDDVWERLKCNLFNHSQSDGSFTSGDVADIKSQIDTDETGVTNILLKQMIDTLGSHGLTNAGRIGGADGDTCSSCGDCADCTLETASDQGTFGPAAPPDGITFHGAGYTPGDGTWTIYNGPDGTNYIEFDHEICIIQVGATNGRIAPATYQIHVGAQSSTDFEGGTNTFTLSGAEKVSRIDFVKDSGTPDGYISISNIFFKFCEPE